jgi:sugar phosphate isomerase/epimerase
MEKQYIPGINLLASIDAVPFQDQMKMIRDCGFGAIFTGWHPAKISEWAEEARKHGLLYQSIHAPFSGNFRASSIWKEGEEGNCVIDALIRCATDCADNGIPVMVVHPFLDYSDVPPTALGLDRFARLIDAAERRGVTVGFENVDDGRYLKALMERFWDSPACGFCFDTGHELCYNDGEDMMALYGEKLCHTHLNDNLGNPEGRALMARWRDDLHLPMGDGIADWRGIMDRIDASPYEGPLICELKRSSDPKDRNYHPVYCAMELEAFYAFAYDRLMKVIRREL